MEGYQERIARQIQKEAAKNGEAAIDLAHAMGVHLSTAERWLRGERIPQRRHKKELAEHWGLPLDAFEFDLEAEEKEIRDQLDRLEAKLDLVLGALSIEPVEDEREEPEDVVDAMAEESERDARKAVPNGSRQADG